MGLQNHISRISAFGFLIKYTKISEISRSSHFGGCTKYAKGCIYTGQLLKTATKKKTRQQQKTSKPHLPPRLIWTSKISGGAQIFIPPPNSFYFKKFHFLFPFFKTFLIWTPSLLCSFKKIARSKFFSLLFPFAHFMCCPLLFCFFLNVWFLLLVKFLLLISNPPTLLAFVSISCPWRQPWYFYISPLKQEMFKILCNGRSFEITMCHFSVRLYKRYANNFLSLKTSTFPIILWKFCIMRDNIYILIQKSGEYFFGLAFIFRPRFGAVISCI